MSTPKSAPLHILIIEDSSMIATMMKMVLQSQGCNVTVAATGKEALKNLSKIKFDLIFSDINLPDTTGFEITREFRRNEVELSKRTPIVGMSTDNCKQKALASGMDGFYRKPLSPDKIAEILKAFT